MKAIKEALADRIKPRLLEEPDPAFAFPASRAMVCVFLLTIGFVFPEADNPTSRSTAGNLLDQQTSKDRNGPAVDNELGTNQRLLVGNNSDRERSSNETENPNEAFQQETSLDVDGNQQKRNAFNGNRSSDRRQPEDSTISNDPHQSKASQKVDQPGKETISSNSTGKNGSGNAGTGDPYDPAESDTERTTERATPRRKRRLNNTTEQATGKIDTVSSQSATSEEGNPGEATPADAQATELVPNSDSTDLISVEESGSYRINWTKLGEAVRQPPSVQTWHPKYDRSISKYRSRLESVISSRNQTNVSDE